MWSEHRLAIRARPVAVALLVAYLSFPAPARAEVRGGIEIGAKGVRAIVVEPGAADAKILLSATQNTTLVAGLAETGRFSPEALTATASAVAGFATRLRKEYQLPDERIALVGSSGLFSALAGKEEAIRTNRAELARAMRTATGLTMDFVDISREAALTVLSVVPPAEADRALLLDVGSGNTKGGALHAGGVLTFGIPFGTVTFADRVRTQAAAGNFAATAGTLRQELLEPALRKELQNKQTLAARDRVYLAGGAVWALATLLHPQDRATHVALTVTDIDHFQKHLLTQRDGIDAPSLAGITDAETRKQAQKDVEQVRKIFTPEQLLAGSEILKALAPTFNLAGEGRQLFFARNAYHGWILGYVLDKARQKAAN